MIEVSKTKFFEIIGPMDVVVNTDIPSLRLGSAKCKSFFKTRSGEVIGKTLGSSPNTKFFLRETVK